MIKSGIDQDALITMFASAGVKQGEALRKATADATLKALQSRELTLDGVRKVVKTVAGAASMGAAKNAASDVDVEAMLGKALSGIDAALLHAVEANRKAIEQFVSQGVSLGEKPMKEALANIEKMEDTFFDAIAKAGKSAGPMQAPWDQALAAMKMKGSDTGSEAALTIQGFMAQTQTALRSTRASGMRAAQAMLDNYAALVSGVLIGMSEGMHAGGRGAAKAAPHAAAPAPSHPAPSAKTAKKTARKRAKTAA